MPDVRSTLARWRIARGAVLGSLILAGAGAVATAAGTMYRRATLHCAAPHYAAPAYTYSGVGIEIVANSDQVIVQRVFPGTPASGALFSGARLVSVDGIVPDDVLGWKHALRGEPGTTVNVEVAYPCGGHKRVAITRDIVRISY